MSGTDRAQIVWSASPSASDIVDGAIGANAITCEDGNSMTVTSGDSYKIGITTVTCTASDSAMNQGSCQFDITIECELSASNCSNGGTFDPTFCECLCQEDYSGETCDDFNPCMVDTSLCTIETGQYCVANDSIVAGYTCECRDYDGFVETADGSCEEMPTLKVAGIKINAPFTVGLRNRRSRAFRRMSRFFIRGMRRLFSTRRATRSFLFFSILGFRSGSVVADMSASFPSNSTLPNVTDIMDTLANATISDGVMNFTVDVSDLAVEDIDSCMTAPCLNGGTCNNTIANFTCTCAPGFGGETCEIDIEAPVVSCPKSALPVNVDPGTAFANSTWSSLPTAMDNVVVNITDSVVCEDDLGNVVISGGAYKAGITLVTCKVLDSDMNEGSCQFKVAVHDNEAPTIACPDNPALAQLGIQTSGVAVVWPSLPSANDTVDGILTPACLDGSGNQVASGDDFGEGLTTIICTAQDAASNEATCNFNITIECVLSAVNCSNGGTFSADFCECLCPSNYTGDTCEDLSPCLMNSSLCSSEVGTTCVASGNSYICECNSWDGYFRQNGSCIKFPSLLLQFTAPTLTFISAYGNTQSAAFSTLASQMERLVLASLQSSPATAEALAVRVLSFAAGSVVTNAAVSFPSNSSLPNATAVANALTPTISDGNTSIPITANSTTSQDADDCNSSPCQNGATCTNTMEGFDCACALGFNGTTCDTNINNCTANLCMNNGTCVDGVDTFTCLCTSDFDGTFCEVDIAPPVLTNCVDTVTVNTTSGSNMGEYKYESTPPTCTDNGGMTSLIYSRTSTLFPIGDTTVTVVCLDEVSLSDVCMFTVTVTDNESPRLKDCPMDQEAFADSTNYTTVTWAAPMVEDNSMSMVDLTLSNSSGTSFPVGTTLVTYTATDPSGNADTCSFNVTVYLEDNLSPVIICSPPSINATVDFGLNSTVVVWDSPMATDNAGVTQITVSEANGTRFYVGETDVVFTAFDRAGNNGSCTIIVTILDTQAPMLGNCPKNISRPTDPGSNSSIVTWTEPIVIENDGYVLTSTASSGDAFPFGQTTVVYSITDDSNLMDSCSFSVIVLDDEPPSYSCLNNMEVSTDSGVANATVKWMVPQATDNVGIVNVTASHMPGVVVDLGNNIMVEYVAIDAAGLTDTCNFSITVKDTEDPVLVGCPASVNPLLAMGASTVIAMWTEPTASDNSGSVTLTATYRPGVKLGIGTHTDVYFASDAAENVAKCSFDIVVEDLEDPVIASCPTDLEAFADPGTNVSVSWTPPKATDNSLSVDVTSNYQPGQEFENGTYIVEYTAVDKSGNMINCSFTIIVYPTDTEPPMITCPVNISVSADPMSNSTSVSWPQPTYMDNFRFGSLNVTHENGSVFFLGTEVVVYTAFDTSGNNGSCSFSVTVEDNEAPVVLSCPNGTVSNTDPTLPTANISWIEPEAMDNSGSVTRSSNYSPGYGFPIGRTLVTYVLSDASNNEVECVFNVTVLDMEAPVIMNCSENINASADPGKPFATLSFDDPDISDNSGNFTIVESSSTNWAEFPVGFTEVFYRVGDESSNRNECNFTIEVTDDEPPTFAACPSVDITNGTLPGDYMGTAYWSSVLPSDNVNVTYTNSSHQPGQVFEVGTTAVEYVAKDAAGEEAFCRFNVVIEDDEKPVIVNCSSDIYVNTTLGSNMEVVDWQLPTATDNSGSVVLTQNDPGRAFPIGETSITYIAADDANNVERCMFSIFVSDYENPVVTCPANVEAFADRGANVSLTWSMPTATDNSMEMVTIESTHPSGFEFLVGTTDITVTATDPSGNSVNCTFQAIVYPTDMQVPVIICPSNIKIPTDQGLDSANVTWPLPQYMDNEEIVVFNVSQQNASLFYIGTTEVSYLVVDRNDNNASCTFIVEVIDNERPVVTFCPTDVVIMNDESRVVHWYPAAFEDNSGTVNITSNFSPDIEFPFGTTFVIYEGVDPSGNRALCNFTIFANDTEDPVIENCPESMDLYLYGSQPNATANWTRLNITDNSDAFSVEQNFYSLDRFPTGTTEVVITVSDGANNTAECVFNVTVKDLSPPVILGCPMNINVTTDLGEDFANVSWRAPQAIDNVELVSLSASQEPGTQFPVGITSVLYTAIDAANLRDDCSFNVTVVDNEKPRFVSCPRNLKVPNDPGSNNASVNFTVEVMDNVNVTNLDFNYEPNDEFLFGVTTVLYRATDAAGNQQTCTFVVEVEDVEGPVYENCLPNVTATTALGSDVASVSWVEPTVIDNSGVMISAGSNKRPGDEFGIGSTTVTYVALDDEGNSGRCEFEVIVTDDEPPTFLNCSMDIDVEIMDPGVNTTVVNWTIPVASDNSKSVVLTPLTEEPGVFSVGTTLIVYSASDPSGNTANCSFNVIVRPYVPEELRIVCPDDMSFETAGPSSNGSAVFWPPPMYNGTVMEMVESNYANNSYLEVGQYLVVYNATARDGRVTSCDFYVSVIDVHPPVIMGCPMDINVTTDLGEDVANVSWTIPQAFDSVELVSLLASQEPGTQFPVGSTVVMYTAIDAANITDRDNCSFSVLVVDDEDPVFSICPSNINEPNDPGRYNASVNFTVEVMDNVNVTNIDANYRPNDVFPVGVTTVVYKATDAAGNQQTCTFDVEVEDVEDPVYENCLPNVTATTALGRDVASVSWTVPTVTDNSGVMISAGSSKRPGDEFGIGSTTVSYVAADDAGNSGVCEFEVIVTDDEDPIFTMCSSNLEAIIPTLGVNTTVVNWTIPVASDNSKSVVVTPLTEEPGVFSVGTTLIVYSASDPSGNTANCSFSVTVFPHELLDLVIACPADMDFDTDPSSNSTVVFWPPPMYNGTVMDLVESNYANNSRLEVGQYLVVYNATAQDGRNTSCDFYISVIDRESPVIMNCPMDILQSTDQGRDTAVVSWGAVSAQDNVGVSTFTSNHQINSSFSIGVTTVRYYSADLASNSDTCVFNVTVYDDEDPMFTFCPSNMEAKTDANGTWVAPTWDYPNATDNSGSVSITTHYAGEMFQLGTVNAITYNATDEAGNTVFCVFNVTIIDGTPPAISNCPGDLVVPTDQGVSTAQVNWTEPTAVDNGQLISLDSDIASGSIFNLSSTVVTYTAVDSVGLVSTCQFNVTVADKEEPVSADCPVNVLGGTSVGQSTGSPFWIAPTFTDNVGVVNSSSNYQPLDNLPIGTTTVIYTAVDAAGNIGNCTFDAMITDNEDPMFTFCPSNMEARTDANGTWVAPTWDYPNATDNSGSVSITTHYAGEMFQLGTVNTITYNAMDEAGNTVFCVFNVTIIDGTPPTISNCSGDLVVPTDQGVSTAQVNWTEPTAVDNDQMFSFDSDIASGSIFNLSSTVVTYTAVDSVGLVSTCQFNVTVADQEVPVVEGCPPRVLGSSSPGLDTGTMFWISPTASDNVGVTSLVSNYVPMGIFPIGTTVVVYTATDAAGNTANCSFDSIIMDSEAPVFSFCPEGINFATGTNGSYAIPTWPMPNVTDNSGDVTLTSDYSGEPLAVGSTTLITYTALDPSSNMQTCSFNVNITDGTPPEVLNCPSDISVPNQLTTASGQGNWSEPTARDNVGVITFESDYNSGDLFDIGLTEVTYTATDAVGLSTICQFNVTVEDIEAPTITNCPGNLFGSTPLGQSTSQVFWINPQTSDNSLATLDVESNFSPSDPFPIGTTTVVYTVTDPSGNSDNCSFNVQVTDSEQPEFSFCPDDLSLELDNVGDSSVIPTWPVPVATDNSGTATLTTDYDGRAFDVDTTTVVTYTATDPTGNVRECVFSVTINNTASFRIRGCPEDIIVSTSLGLPTGVGNWTAPTATDDGTVVNLTTNYEPLSIFDLGVTEVNYTAVNDMGLQAECLFNVTVIDTEDPVFTSCPVSFTTYAPAGRTSVFFPAWTNPTYSDNANQIYIAFSPLTALSMGLQLGTTTITYTATDAAGNEAFCIFNFTLLDRAAFRIQGCPEDIIVSTSLGLPTGVGNWTAPTAPDDGTVVNLTTNYEPLSIFDLGVTEVNYTAVNDFDVKAECLFNVTVIDTMKPVIADCPVDIVKNITGSSELVDWTPPTASDNVAITNESYSHLPNTSFAVGSLTTVMYTYEDAAGNEAVCRFVIIVQNISEPVDRPPTFNSCPSNMFVNTTLNEDFAVVTWPVPMAVDDNGSPIVVEQNGYNTGRRFNIGQWMVMYVATDSIGQTASCDFSVTVTDNEKPVIQNCPADITRVTTAGSMVAVSWNPPSSSDNSGEYSMTVNDNHVSGDTFAIGVYNVIYTAMDPSGNAETCVFVITIEEDMPPEFASCPQSTTVSTDPGEAFATVGFSYPRPTDDRSTPILMGSHAPGSQFPLGDTQVVYTAYDSAGQSTECVFVITVEDRGDPIVMNCPSDITIYVLSASSEAAVFWIPPTANDTSAVTLSSNKDPGDLFGSGTTKVTYTATDAADNEDSCSFSVTVQEINPTYETDGTVELVRIANTSSSSFTQNFVDAAIDDLIADLDKLFRLSSVAANFIGITLDTASLSNDNKATVKFIISFIGSPPPNDTDIVNAFTSSLTGVSTNEFDTGNAVTVGSFLLSQQDCRQIPCQNDGTCALQGSSYTCSCTASWSGDTCELDVDECLTTPCASDRVCINTLGSYICGCASGFFLVGDSCISVSQFSGSFAVTRIGAQTAVFSAALEDASTQEYQSVVSDVTAVLDGIFSTEPSFIESQVLGMSSGSIMVEYLLIFASDTELNEDAVTKQMSASVSGDGEIANSDIYIRPSSLTVAIEICPSGFCKNSGTCSPDPVTYESTCTCSKPYSGDRCEITDVWSPIVIAMVATAGVLSIVLIALFFACCFFLGKRLDEKEPKYPGIYDIEQRDSYNSSLPSKKQSRSSNAPPSQPSGRRIQTSFATSVDLDAGNYRQNDDDLADVSFVNHVFDIQNDESAHVPHLHHGLQEQTLGYTDDVPRDYPMATFMRPYIATGQEASEQFHATQGRRHIDADYF
ncbi:uncharacterized protein [Asterias amurensis]|uniref:uncharacterized protein isoform X3 n=1 Tax=Asterias amurensis TaxID=7602 RepID=UPI003AB5ABE0